MAPATQPKRSSAPVFIACSVLTSSSPSFGGTASKRPSAREIEHLTADHAAEARGARQRQHQLETNVRIGMRLRAREDVEREGQQAVAGEDRGGLVERLVRRRPAAPQIVVVHGGQIVVRERIAMHAFERRAGHQRLLARHIEQRRALDHQERPEALAAAEAHIAHGLEQSRRARALALDRRRRQQAVEQGLGVLRDLPEAVLEHRFDIHAFFHRFAAGHAYPPRKVPRMVSR